MEISEIRVKPIENASDRLKAYCSITIDGCFVVRDLKIIEGASGLFVAMPSRKLAARCRKCGSKNHLRARFCNDCGSKVEGEARPAEGPGRNKLHADIAHPINAPCREFIQSRVIEEYQVEMKRAEEPGYDGSAYDDEDYADEPAEPDQGKADAPESGSPYEELIEGLKSDAARAEPVQAEVTKVEPPACPKPAPPPAESGAKVPNDSPRPTTGDEFGSGIL